MDKSLIGLIVFFAAWIGGRAISERAMKILSEREKARLLDGFSNYRIFNLVGVVALAGLHFTLRAFVPNSYYASFPAFVGVLVLYLLFTSMLSYRKLKKLEISDSYINQFLLSTFVQYTGIFIFFGFMLSRYR